MYHKRRDRRAQFGRGRSGQLPPKPVKVGEEYDVEIKELSRRGDGIARIKGLVTFIPQTRPGDHLKVRITRIGRRHAEATVIAEKAEA